MSRTYFSLRENHLWLMICKLFWLPRNNCDWKRVESGQAQTMKLKRAHMTVWRFNAFRNGFGHLLHLSHIASYFSSENKCLLELNHFSSLLTMNRFVGGEMCINISCFGIITSNEADISSSWCPEIRFERRKWAFENTFKKILSLFFSCFFNSKFHLF